MRRHFALLLALACLPPRTVFAQAPDFSGKTMRLVVQFAPGGVPDTLARMMAPRLAERLKATVLVENRPGATGAIAAMSVKNAEPDGLTLLMADSSTYAIAPFIKQSLPYDPLRDFAPVSVVAQAMLVLMCHTGSAASVADLVARARRKPGLPYGSPGVGSVHHLAMEMLKQAAGLDLLHIPHKSMADMVPSVVSGDVGCAFAGLNTAKNLEKIGKVAVLATVTPQRSRLAPEVPTFVESGYPSLSLSMSFGLFAPARTPHAVLLRLSEEIAKVAVSPGFAEGLAPAGLEPASSTPEQLTAMVLREQRVFSEVIKAGHITEN